MTLPAAVYESTKVAEDSVAAKGKIDHSANIQAGMQCGRNPFSQLWEYYKLSRSPGGLDFNDYYLYKLYDESQFSFEDKQAFVSERFYFKIIQKCCDPKWWILADDKSWSYTVLQANDFPVPETQGVFCEGGRVFGTSPTLTDAQQLDNFLSEQAKFPIYAKPVMGIGSLGNFLIEDYVDSNLYLHDGSHMPLERFVNEIDSTTGQLLQSTLNSHPDLADVCGRVSTIRVILIMRNNGPKILHTVWKIPSAQNIADNFWRNGNMLAAVNNESGKVERVVCDKEGTAELIDPDSPTAERFLGMQLPDWEGVLDLCDRGSRLFSPLKFQSWDIALTDTGPVIMELNPGSAFNLSQLAEGKGFLTDDFREFLTDCGCKL